MAIKLSMFEIKITLQLAMCSELFKYSNNRIIIVCT